MFDQDDPIITAYVLGEVSAEQKGAIEAQMEADPSFRDVVLQTRATTELLSTELGSEAFAPLTDIERQQVRNQKVGATVAPKRRFWLAGLSVAGVGVAAAAAFAFLALEKKEEAVVVNASQQPNANQAVAAMGEEGNSRRLAGKRYASKTADSADPNASTDLASGRAATISSTPTTKSRVSKEAADKAGYRPSKKDARTGSGPSGGDGYVARAGGHREERTVVGNGVIGDMDPGPLEPIDGSRDEEIVENKFIAVAADPRSTFSIDVDTASYSNMRRSLNGGQMPPKNAIRIEELVNYFDYNYESPKPGETFALHSEVTAAPWNPQHRLVRLALKGQDVLAPTSAGKNLVFLLDVSGSMKSAQKLPLLRRAMAMLINSLSENDRIAVVVYAGASGLVLPSTKVSNKRKILNSLERLQAGGSTNGGAGIQLAYQVAQEQFVQGGVNRVILATDGDFNVGTTSRTALIELIEKKAKSNVFLTVLGFGMGNGGHNDAQLEQIADHGNGQYAFIDTINEARKVLVNDLHATLVAIAKDVKIQIEFNPKTVHSYRLIGYENRILEHKQFNDDKVDAGDVGAGHRVTALYEVVPVGLAQKGVDPLKYQVSDPKATTTAANSGELLTLKLRYKTPEGSKSTLREFAISDEGGTIKQASAELRFAAAVAGFGMLLRNSEHRGEASYRGLRQLAASARGRDIHGYRAEFIKLVRTAERLTR